MHPKSFVSNFWGAVHPLVGLFLLYLKPYIFLIIAIQYNLRSTKLWLALTS